MLFKIVCCSRSYFPRFYMPAKIKCYSILSGNEQGFNFIWARCTTLLKPDREGRSRFYGARERARMKLILRGRRFGFQLEEIRQWLLIYENEGNQAQMQAFIEMADRQMGELQKQREQLDEALDELGSLRATTHSLLK